MRREKRKRKQERKTVVEVPTLVCPQTRTLMQGRALACTRSFEVQMRIHQKKRKKTNNKKRKEASRQVLFKNTKVAHEHSNFLPFAVL